ncbi:CBS domain-containing protein [Halogeometricum borinquense]|uniref:Signal-transduction protein containing camp-binding and cbs domains n=2 Tax=Halogeometricum borinquense TaxID=60847 RepID=E4NKT5_HALBP|nr:CBS domain-containing protein [Halogeometricum borinquense]ADQ65981.1 predicted signal-transduction protein containing cAMP-binding and CBS domains [Halogeometricum borinquense DSM 11551]ELY23137.1 signal-transduction protein containing camp-binding and cbs domains [Halogeometricum borinquense DSM 11551]QIB76165.1 CBS domain-containing protein [Halogeometricum borinquense]QIQ75395.1 CBS domain-containing protein [Halogeometricum borinquense]RYJ19602.1 CBS domain-containing protein [Halogeom
MLDELLRTDVPTAAPETPIADVATVMRDTDADAVVVLDEDRPLGIITPATLGRAVVAGEDLGSESVAELVSGDPVTIRRVASRSDLVAVFAREDVREAIVLDEMDQYVGIVSFKDVLTAYSREFDALLDLLE